MKIKLFLIVMFAIIYTSCKHNHEATKLEEPKNEKMLITAYSNDFEVFAESDAFIVGKTSNLFAHFSTLSDFKALESGTITARLVVNGNETSQSLDKPTRNGIYSFDITPETIGTGQIIFDIKTDKENFQVIVPNIVVYDTEDEARIIATEAVVSKTNTTVFTKEQIWKIDFSTELPKKEAFGQVIKTTAQVESAQGDELIITAKTNGIITLSNNSIFEGKGVSRGQLILSISGNQLADNNISVRFSEAKNNFEKAKADFERATALAKDKIVSEKDLRNTKNIYDNAKANFENLNKNFSSTGQNVLSPMKGFIKQIWKSCILRRLIINAATDNICHAAICSQGDP